MSRNVMRWKPQPSTVIAMIALFVAIGGTAVATVSKNQVKSKHVKNDALKAVDLKDGKAVGSAEVIDDTLTGADINESSLTIAGGGGGAPTGPAGGDLTGTYPNPTIASNAINSAKVAVDALTADDLAPDSADTSEIASNAINSAKVAVDALVAADLANNSVGIAELAPDAVNSANVVDESLAATDLATNSVGSAEIETDGVGATEIQNDSIDSGEIIDFGLSNQDVGVLFAQVNANGTLANSSGLVTSTNNAAGDYTVDFSRNVTGCAPIATLGLAGTGNQVDGMIDVSDETANVEAVAVDTNNTAGVNTDKAFHLIVVC